MVDWSPWASFPDPRRGDMLLAPFGPGCYELRHGSQLVLFGMGGHVAARMTSLLPPPLGNGTRNNDGKRKYIEQHLSEIEYRTLACRSRQEAAEQERSLRANRSKYRFQT
jgi:hypothetical protein